MICCVMPDGESTKSSKCSGLLRGAIYMHNALDVILRGVKFTANGSSILSPYDHIWRVEVIHLEWVNTALRH